VSRIEYLIKEDILHPLDFTDLEQCRHYVNGAFGSLHFRGIGIHSIK
jgi:hypothetical protein